MKTLKISLLILCITTVMTGQDLTVKDLTVEHKTNPMGLNTQKPRLSWKVLSAGNNIMQTAFSIRVASDSKFTSGSAIWQSGKIDSDGSVLQEYNGPALNSGQRYYWQVKVWDNKGRESKWSETAYWETGLFSESDWKARWIEMHGDTNRYSPSPYFRKEFTVTGDVAKAVVYVSSHGLNEIHVNGEKVGDQVLTPGWTSYGKRIQYQVYDLTGRIVKGSNAIGAILGDGWYRGTLAWGNNWAIYGRRLGLLIQLKITYKNGKEELIVTDESWKCTNDGAIRMNDLYNGEIYDANKIPDGWNIPGYDDTKWQPVKTAEYAVPLVAEESVPVRKIQEIKPVKIFKTPSGSLVADMGQNMVGWIRLKVSGPKGTEVRIRHAEVLDKYGEFYTENLRSAKCEIQYTLAGKGEESYEPRFTFMGFRFIEVSGFPGTLTADNITGIVIHSDMKPSGYFECSDPLLNQLQHNIVWGQKGNFVDIPTDCPQRDERLGWTGDAQAFSRTAAFNFYVAPFFTKWLKDLALDQKPGGEVPDVIPDVLNPQKALTAQPSAGWGDVAVIVPWNMYIVYGDKKLLETQYPSMKAWVEYIKMKSGESYIWKGGSKYGDWLFYHPPVNNHSEPDGHTDHNFIATAFYAYSTSILAKAAKELGKTEDEKYYNDLYNKIKSVFINEYVTPAGRIGTTSQTAYVLALQFDLLPENLRQKASQFLVDDIKSRRNHLSTGFLGTVFLTHVLTQTGHTDVAYDLLFQPSYPSWLYPVKMGATTIWERWDGQKTDSTFQDAGMNSFNHYAYGAIGDWMYRVSAGIEARSPGYKKILIQPHITSRLTYVKASYESMYGTIGSEWERRDGKLVFRISIPCNTEASIILPAEDLSKIKENGLPLSTGKPDFTISLDTMEGRAIGLTRGSGNYIFEIAE